MKVKLYKVLCKKHEIYLAEYNSYLKSGDEMTKVEVKLFDDTNTKNLLIEEDLETVNRMKSTFMPGKKVAAISTAVGTYFTAAKSQQLNK